MSITMADGTVVITRTALASVHPCQLYAHSVAPKPSRTQGHHRYPVYLQNEVYGKIVRPELFWVCGLCHDSIHDWISWLLDRARRPDPESSYKAKIEARRTVNWYLDAVATKLP